MNLTRVAILMGGKSSEHEISLISAMNITAALDRNRYEPVLFGISKDGRWFLQDEQAFMAQEMNPKTVRLVSFDKPVGLVPGAQPPHFMDLKTGEMLPEPAVVFGILHGTNGEDGTMQGLLHQINLPFVGPDVAGSAVAMDKDLAKRLLNEAGIPNAPFVVYQKHERSSISWSEVTSKLQLPLFVKPARQGSSVGVSKVKGENDFFNAIDEAFRYDTKILIEQGVVGREIECAVLGNAEMAGSAIGEVVPPEGGFYDYEAKYIDADGAKLYLPAPGLDDSTIQRVQKMAVKACQALACEGLTRVDFFLQPDGQLLVNELNTLPGFTKISMYPSLWRLSGIAYPDLIHQLLQLAIARKAEQDALSTQKEF
jgi:D-alanine-D-alanine ligase